MAMMTITMTTMALIKVTAELERIRCALQSRDDEVEALRREVGELIETLKDNEPPTQRPKKSELSGWQLSTRKNFPDEARKSFSRQKCAKSA